MVAKGVFAKDCLDYYEVFAPMARIQTIKLVVATTTFRGWPLHQLDVKLAFANGSLKENIYMSQPPAFEVTGHEDKVYNLKKASYGIKQTPQAWDRRIYCFFFQLGFSRRTTEYGAYVRATISDLMIVCIYVDDLPITSSNAAQKEKFKRRTMLEFDRIAIVFLGMEFVSSSEGVLIHQKRYAIEILKIFQLLDCNFVQTLVDYGIKL